MEVAVQMLGLLVKHAFLLSNRFVRYPTFRVFTAERLLALKTILVLKAQ